MVWSEDNRMRRAGSVPAKDVYEHLIICFEQILGGFFWVSRFIPCRRVGDSGEI